MAEPLLSPSTITAWLDCDFYLTVKLGGNQGARHHPGAFAELLMAKGRSHEEACLAEFEAAASASSGRPEPTETRPLPSG